MLSCKKSYFLSHDAGPEKSRKTMGELAYVFQERAANAVPPVAVNVLSTNENMRLARIQLEEDTSLPRMHALLRAVNEITCMAVCLAASENDNGTDITWAENPAHTVKMNALLKSP